MVDFNTDFFKYQSGVEKRPYDIVSMGVQPNDARLTIIITTFNRKELLIESLESAICQKTKYPYKILLIDNCSSSSIVSSPDFLAKYSSKNVTIVINRDNYGMFGNMNQGASIANTEYISYLHDDDIYSDNFVEEVMDTLTRHSNISSLHVGVSRISKGERIEKKLSNKLRKSPVYDVLFNGPVAPTGIVFKRDDFLKYGGYNENYHPTADYCLAVLMSYFTNYYKLQKSLCYYRVEDNDSLKAETLSLFVNNDYYLMNCVLKKYRVPNFVIRGIQQFRVPSQISGLRDEFNSSFVYDYTQLGIQKEGNWLWYAVCRMVLIVWIGIADLFK